MRDKVKITLLYLNFYLNISDYTTSIEYLTKMVQVMANLNRLGYIYERRRQNQR